MTTNYRNNNTNSYNNQEEILEKLQKDKLSTNDLENIARYEPKTMILIVETLKYMARAYEKNSEIQLKIIDAISNLLVRSENLSQQIKYFNNKNDEYNQNIKEWSDITKSCIQTLAIIAIDNNETHSKNVDTFSSTVILLSLIGSVTYLGKKIIEGLNEQPYRKLR
ncbi:MAG: hypothetical protein DSM106950_44315 [Stigonema ocellatum SAG 48.90 = DSM 106950]|nr:hypothetical protein [Stigonema ocellatum SAG 48.90 = DSM 106950]